MARQPQVTRTITTTVCNVLCVDTEKKDTKTIEVTLPRTYANEKAMLKAIEKAPIENNLKPVQVEDFKVVETLYGMSEQDFITHATVLPPRENKDNDTKPNNK